MTAGRRFPCSLICRTRRPWNKAATSIIRSKRAGESSEQERDEGPGLTAIGFVVGAEGFAHGSFFHADLAPVRERHDDERDGRVNFAGHESYSEIHSEHSGVNRMAYVAVWTRANELVPCRDPYFPAPVAAKCSPRPHGEEDESG